MANNCLSYDEILDEAQSTWGGETGLARKATVKQIIDSRLSNYSEVTGLSESDILLALEKARRINTVNFYQESNLPLIDGEKVKIFDTLQDFKEAFPSGKSLCPSCNRESDDYYECSQEDCKWKVYGLFKDMGKGITVVVKSEFLDNPVPITIFRPVECAA